MLIEHLWSPMSKKLSSVRLKAVDRDDQHPSCCLSGLSDTERSKKEAGVFDKAVSDQFWKDVSFNGFKVKPVRVPYIPSDTSFYTDHEHPQLPESTTSGNFCLKVFPNSQRFSVHA